MTKGEDRLHEIVDALKRTEAAIDKLKRRIEDGAVGDLGERLAEVSQDALRDLEDLVKRSETLNQAQIEARGAVRRHPLTALALAFGAGLALALLTRG